MSEQVEKELVAPGPMGQRASVARLVPLAIAIALIGAALYVLNSGDVLGVGRGLGSASAAPVVGSPAPDFTLSTLSGETVSLNQYRGKPVVINFWATWCGPCRAEMPAIERAYQKYADQELVVLAVDEWEGPMLVEAFIQDIGVTFDPLMDTNGEVGALYRVNGLPITFFVDRDGVIRDIALGGMTESILEAKLQKIL